MKHTDIDDRRWQAVTQRDGTADGEFVFAVVTTGVYCRPSCRARRPLRHNVRFFAATQAAEQAGFRPCKRCQPDKASPHAAQQARIAEACRLLEASDAPLTLEALAKQVAMSPYHFHRLFKATTGLTPKAWQQASRADKVRDALSGGKDVTRALFDAGYASGSVFYQQADAALGMTARQFRQGGTNTRIQFALGRCQLGEFLVAESERGVCAILLGDDPQALLHELETSFPQAQLEPGNSAFDQRVAQVIGWLERPEGEFALPLDLRGTAFQREVWQALRAIAPGSTVSYQELARRIGRPRATRAVAGACAANRLAVVVPCHRVIRQDGGLSGYRWGVERKRALLEREAQEE